MRVCDDVGRFLMGPTRPLAAESFGPSLLGVLDPLYRRYCQDNAAALLEARISGLRADLRPTMEGLIGALTHGNARAILTIAARGDWLFLETQLAQVLAELIWAARLLGDAPTYDPSGCEATLTAWCRTTGSLAALERVLTPITLRDQAIGLVEVMEAALRHIHARVGEFPVDTEDWFRWGTFERRREEGSKMDLAQIAAAADRIAESLSALPTCQGVCINGSFAEPAKRDGFNDLDLCCFCSARPSAAARAEFLARLGLKQRPRDDAFEYLQVDAVNTHLIFVEVGNQRKAAVRLRSAGDEAACLHFLHPEFALSAYHLQRARILRDPFSVIQELQADTALYPEVLKDRVRATWLPVWTTWRERFREAQADADRAHAWIAHRYAAEAALRLMLADHALHANPIEPKWFPQEIAALPEGHALGPAAGNMPLQVRFTLLRDPRPQSDSWQQE